MRVDTHPARKTNNESPKFPKRSVKDGDTAAAATADSRVRCSTYADTVDKNAGKLPWRLVNDTASTKDSTKFAAELRVGGSANFNRTSLRPAGIHRLARRGRDVQAERLDSMRFVRLERLRRELHRQ